MLHAGITATLACCSFACALAQTPVSREAAIASATALGPRVAIARADTALAYAGLVSAREWPNPGLGVIYTRSTPHYSVLVDLPLDLPALRRSRIGSARSSRNALEADSLRRIVMAKRSAGNASDLEVAPRCRGAASDVDRARLVPRRDYQYPASEFTRITDRIPS